MSIETCQPNRLEAIVETKLAKFGRKAGMSVAAAKAAVAACRRTHSSPIDDVVTWLRMPRDGVDTALLHGLAEAIERGEHVGASESQRGDSPDRYLRLQQIIVRQEAEMESLRTIVDAAKFLTSWQWGHLLKDYGTESGDVLEAIDKLCEAIDALERTSEESDHIPTGGHE